MPKKKNFFKSNINWIIPSILLIIVIIIIGLFVAGVIKLPQSTLTTVTDTTIIEKLNNPTNIPGVSCSLSVTPGVITAGDLITGKIKAEKNTFCEVFGKHEDGEWLKFAEGTTDSLGNLQATDNFWVDGDFTFKAVCGDCVTNDASVKVNTAEDVICTDTDDGKNKYKPGITTIDGIPYMDACSLDNTKVTEFWCNGDVLGQEDINCEIGETCVQTRSGGHCQVDDSGYSEGDTISSDSGSGILPQGGQSWDLSMGELSVGGNCGVKALISTSWNYVNEEACMGVAGLEGVSWIFSDSVSVKYSRLDQVPVAMGVPTACNLEYDGVTPFELTMLKKFNYPDCDITFNWEVDLVACNCFQ